MWSYEMNIDQLNMMTCGTQGDVSSSLTLKQMRKMEVTEEPFPYCKGRLIKGKLAWPIKCAKLLFLK